METITINKEIKSTSVSVKPIQIIFHLAREVKSTQIYINITAGIMSFDDSIMLSGEKHNIFVGSLLTGNLKSVVGLITEEIAALMGSKGISITSDDVPQISEDEIKSLILN